MTLPAEFLDTVFRDWPPGKTLPDRFAIVTAWNPEGIEVSREENDLADEKLHRHLLASRLVHFRLTGSSPDGNHYEPGWAVALETPGAGIALGRKFRQLAVWWIENDRLFLADCRDATFTEVDSFTARLIT